MTPTCANREEWLGPFLYDDLPFDVGMAAEEHVRLCAECDAEARSLEAVVAVVPKPRVPVSRRPLRWLGLAAAAVLVAAVGFFAGRSLPRPAPPLARAPAPPASPAPGLMSPEVQDYLKHGRGGLTDSERKRLDERLK